MKQIIPLLVLAFILRAPEAGADCIGMQDAARTVTIDSSYAPVHDGAGYQHPGCILKADGQVLGYTSYDYLCHVRADEKINVRLSYGCCDTGPDSGDLVCTVRAGGLFGLAPVHGNGVGVTPAEMDARAIDDLIHTLQGDYVFSYYGASRKLLEYLADARYKAAVTGRRGQLEEIAANGKRADQRGYAANVLLHMDNESPAGTVDQIVRVLGTESVFDEVVVPAIEKAADYPQQVDKTAPALLYFLKRKQYDKNKAEAVLATLEKLGASLKPFMPQLLEYEYEWSDRGHYFDFPQRAEYYKRMNRIVCNLSPEDANRIDRSSIRQYPNHNKDIEFRCPPRN